MTMILAKKIGRATLVVATMASLSLIGCVGFSSRRRRIDSITTMAPSTMMPKSIAPSDSRLAGMCDSRMAMKAISRDRGITVATISALRGLPRKRIKTRMTRPMPSIMVRDTVASVVRTSSVRSR